MTTIATDGETIAADGLRSTSSGEIIRYDAVKIRSAHGRIYGLVGTSSVTDIVIDWHAKGANPEAVPKGGDWTLLVIDRDGLCAYHHDLPYPDRVPYPAAYGSGDRFALGAMDAGASPEEAVAIASKRCAATGGKITVINIAEATGFGAEVINFRAQP